MLAVQSTVPSVALPAWAAARRMHVGAPVSTGLRDGPQAMRERQQNARAGRKTSENVHSLAASADKSAADGDWALQTKEWNASKPVLQVPLVTACKLPILRPTATWPL